MAMNGGLYCSCIMAAYMRLTMCTHMYNSALVIMCNQFSDVGQTHPQQILNTQNLCRSIGTMSLDSCIEQS